MVYVSYDEAVREMAKGLSRFMDEENAKHFAEIFAGNSLDGIYSHGMNRYPRYIGDMESGICDPKVTKAEKVGGFSALEVYDAHFGVGPLIAEQITARAIELAKEHGIACVAMRNNSHWLRAGRYGLMMADAGLMGICFTNTCMNLTAWGTLEPSTGNNPITFAIPREKGSLVMDMAVSQYAYGKLEIMAQEGKMLDTPCGYDADGNPTCDPQKDLRERPDDADGDVEGQRAVHHAGSLRVDALRRAHEPHDRPACRRGKGHESGVHRDSPGGGRGYEGRGGADGRDHRLPAQPAAHRRRPRRARAGRGA